MDKLEWMELKHKLYSPIHWVEKRIEVIQDFFFWGWKLRENYDWDGSYLLEMIEYKVVRMEEYFRTKGHYVGCERDAKKMQKLVDLIKTLRADDYDLYLKVVEAKWGRTEMVFGKERESGNGKISSCTFRNKYVITPEDKKQYNKEWKVAMKKDATLQRRDYAKMVKLLGEVIKLWD